MLEERWSQVRGRRESESEREVVEENSDGAESTSQWEQGMNGSSREEEKCKRWKEGARERKYKNDMTAMEGWRE